MADEFVDCRRKGDHSETHRIARSALPYFPDWEPIPIEDTEPNQGAATAPEQPEADATETSDDATAKPAKTARKSTESKGRGE